MELLPCPFCQSKLFRYGDDFCIRHEERCFLAQAGILCFGKQWISSEADIAAWNTRTPPDRGVKAARYSTALDVINEFEEARLKPEDAGKGFAFWCDERLKALRALSGANNGDGAQHTQEKA